MSDILVTPAVAAPSVVDLNMSLSAPPVITSPAVVSTWKTMVSAPAPALILSLPLPPVMVSAPPPPLIVSALALPVMVSTLALPVMLNDSYQMQQH